MRRFFSVLISVLVCFFSISCSNDEINLYIVDGAPTLTVAKIINDGKIGNAKVNVKLVSSTDALTTAILNGSADVAVMPVNLAQKLYNNGVEVELLTVNVFGCLYIVGKDDVSSLDDFKGKEIGLVGRNGTPDISLKYLLSNKDIPYGEGETADGVKLKYLQNDLVVQSLKTNQVKYALIGEPLVTKASAKVEGLKPLINLKEEWGKVANGKLYTQAGVVVSERVSKDGKLLKGLYSALNDNLNFVYENVDALNEIMPTNSALKDVSFTDEILNRCSLGCRTAKELSLDIDFYLTTMGESFSSGLIYKGEL